MRYEDFVADVMARGGFEDAGEAERAIAAVARVLGERLLAEERAPLAAVLPDPARRRLVEAQYERDFDLPELYDRVARSTAIRHDFGLEHAQVVCQAIAELLPEDAARRLPPEIRPLFVRRPRGVVPPRPLHVHARPDVDPGAGTTLASGRPGSQSPLSEANPEAKR